MIAEAVDAALLLWRALWLWLLAGAVVVTVGGLGAVAGVWWVCASLRAWIARRGPQRGLGAPQGASRGSAVAETATEPGDGRTRPPDGSASTDTPAAPPRSRHTPRWAAPQEPGGPFLAPTRQRAAEARTGDPAPKEAA